MNNVSYLIHFNKNHDPKNGQFAAGDGDGDGKIDDRHTRANQKMETGKYLDINPTSKTAPGTKKGYHRSNNFLDFPYYVDQSGTKHYYNTLWELPRGDRGREYVHNIGKFLALPVTFLYSSKVMIDDARNDKKFRSSG